MPVLTERNYLGDWLKYELENQYSRDVVTILAGTVEAEAPTTGVWDAGKDLAMNGSLISQRAVDAMRHPRTPGATPGGQWRTRTAPSARR